MNSTRTATCVFPFPSKIPYGGFSPVRLQTEIQPPPSARPAGLSAARIPLRTRLIGGHRAGFSSLRPTKGLTVGGASAPAPSGTASGRTARFRPEALGSPAGYAVPPGQRLLWPHPSLSVPPADLCIRQRVLLSIGLNRKGTERFPNLLRTPVPSCRPPYPGGPDGCRWLYFTVHAGLRHLRTGSASTGPHASVPVWSCNEAARFALCYGPKDCLPRTDQGFYARACAGPITWVRRRV
jgi:hypothetical protein